MTAVVGFLSCGVDIGVGGTFELRVMGSVTVIFGEEVYKYLWNILARLLEQVTWKERTTSVDTVAKGFASTIVVRIKPGESQIRGSLNGRVAIIRSRSAPGKNLRVGGPPL